MNKQEIKKLKRDSAARRALFTWTAEWLFRAGVFSALVIWLGLPPIGTAFACMFAVFLLGVAQMVFSKKIQDTHHYYYNWSDK